MYKTFTDRARKVMQLANQEAQRFNHDYVGTEHILLGLVKEGVGIAANALKNLYIELPTLRLEVEKIVRWGPANMVTSGTLPQTTRARSVIASAFEEARNLHYSEVGTEHLLLALLREQEGVATQVLLNLGIRLDHLRNAVLAVIQAPTYRQESTSSTPALAAQSPAADGRSEEKIQASCDVAPLQDQSPLAAISAQLHRSLPNLHRLVARPGVLGRMWNFLVDLVGWSDEELPPYEEPPDAERYTPRARLVLNRACVEAFWMHHDYLGTKHILLGLLSEGTATRILEKLGITRRTVHSELLRLVRFGPELLRVPDPMRWTPPAQRVLDCARAAAERDSHDFVRPEHILLGVISEEEGVAGHVLLSRGLSVERIWEEIQRLHSSAN
jgi:ATP-dependent Clp protease ATP-binding subunit ClpA